MSRSILLGVDFGTTYTSAGAIIDDRVALVTDEADPCIPSVVHLPDSGPVRVGRRAVARSLAEPDATVRSVKRLMGWGDDPVAMRSLARSVPYPIAGLPSGAVALTIRRREWAAEQIAGYILDRVRCLAEQQFAGRVKGVVVSTSAVATPRYHTALRSAARMARLEVIDTVSEPIAGALAVGLHARADRRRVLVCDFGGGTFDVALLEQDGLRFQVVATGGDPFLGGDDLDQAMVQALAGIIYRRARFDILHDQVLREALTTRCEAVKRQLSTANEATLVMREAYLQHGQRHDLDVRIDRAWVEPLWHPLFARGLGEVDRLLASVGWDIDDVGEVVLIGGTALVPRFQQLVRERFARSSVTISGRANVDVAIGATLMTGRHLDAGIVPVLANRTTRLRAQPAA